MGTKSNIVFITVDCLRYDRCGFNGYRRNTTPTIDTLAQNSRIYDNAVSSGPWTSESFPGILSGLLSKDCPFYHEVPWRAIPDDEETIASWLSDVGYHTHAVVTNPHLSPTRNFDVGFDTFENLRIEKQGEWNTTDNDFDDPDGVLDISLSDVTRRMRERLRNSSQRGLRNPFAFPFVGYRHHQVRNEWPTIDGKDVIDRSIERLNDVQARDDDSPFFFWTHLMDLHAPIHPERARAGGLTTKSNIQQFIHDTNRISHTDDQGYVELYDSTVRYIDDQLNRLFRFLKYNALWNDTVVVLTADHGEALQDRGFWGHLAGGDNLRQDPKRYYLFDELLHVPLLIRTPDTNGSRMSELTSLTEIHSILGQELETASPLRTEGIDKTPNNKRVAIADAIGQDGQTITVRGDRIKATTELTDSTRRITRDSLKAYDITVDPTEQHPLSNESIPDSFVSIASNVQMPVENATELPNLEESASINSETEALLEDLGYR